MLDATSTVVSTCKLSKFGTDTLSDPILKSLSTEYIKKSSVVQTSRQKSYEVKEAF